MSKPVSYIGFLTKVLRSSSDRFRTLSKIFLIILLISACKNSESVAALSEHFSFPNLSLQSRSVLIETDEFVKGNDLVENWQLSQFWYDDDTATILVHEAVQQIPVSGSVALIGCPSLYYFLKKRTADTVQVKLLEIDRRFEAYKEDFYYYDYNRPLPPHLPEEWRNSFDLVIVDPPFLSEECLEKCSQTVKFLTKRKIIVCTGAVMKMSVERLFNVIETNFCPRHKNNLGNEFACFINYESQQFSKLMKMD